MLDTILFFIEVGMPLKTLKNYIGKDNTLDQQRVLRDGKRAVEEKIAAMQMKLATTEFDLLNLEQNRWCNEQQGLFERHIEKRFLAVAPFGGDWHNPIQREKEGMNVFYRAQQAGMLPTFPAGILLRFQGTAVEYFFFVQVLRPMEEEHVLCIPQGVFSCLQVELSWNLDIPNLIKTVFGPQDDKLVLMNMILRDVQHVDSRYAEIQIPSCCCHSSFPSVT